MNEIDSVVYYPIFFTPHITMQRDILVYIPDFNIYTEGYDIENAINMAKDAIINTISETKVFVEPSSVSEAYEKAREDADEIFDFYKDGMLTFVKVDISDLIKSNFESEIEVSEDKKMEELQFIDDKLFVYTSLPQYGPEIYKKQLVMTKEVFQECYKKWIDFDDDQSFLKNEKDQKDIPYNILEVLISSMFDNRPFNDIINELKEKGCYSKDLELMIRRKYNKKNFIDSMNSLSESEMFEPRSKFND